MPNIPFPGIVEFTGVYKSTWHFLGVMTLIALIFNAVFLFLALKIFRNISKVNKNIIYVYWIIATCYDVWLLYATVMALAFN